MTHPFQYHRAASADDAARRLAEPGAVPLGGGTDLLVLVEERLVHPTALVDLRSIPGSRGVTEETDGAIRVGAATRLADLATHPVIRARFRALAEACEAVGTPALRNMGTIGGNLCQRPRCWYFRRNIACHKTGGDGCPAVAGENRYLAILDGGPCHIVHPSDAAVALTALGASLVIERAGTQRIVPIDEFYLLPRERMDQETVLEPGEFVRDVVLPADAAGGRQLYRKQMQRGTWDFALASIAATRRGDGEVRLVLGGVAPRPWRVNSSIEEDVASGGLDADTIATLAQRALYDASPLSQNGYKVQLADSLLREAIAEVAA